MTEEQNDLQSEILEVKADNKLSRSHLAVIAFV